jgi:uncharacterized peroxidase-related enzyme
VSYLRNNPVDENLFPAFAEIRNQFGFLPKFYPEQALRPDMIDAELKLMDAILLTEGALVRRQKEYIFLVCSAENLSTYCVTAHCEIIRMLRLEGPEPEQIAVDFLHSQIPVADKALLGFCTKLNNHPLKITGDDVERLRTYGFSEQQILEAVQIVSFCKFANTLAFGLGLVPDFHNQKIKEALQPAENPPRAASANG